MLAFAVLTDECSLTLAYEFGGNTLVLCWRRDTVFVLAGDLVEVVYTRRHREAIFFGYVSMAYEIERTARSDRCELFQVFFTKAYYVRKRNNAFIDSFASVGMIDTMAGTHI